MTEQRPSPLPTEEQRQPDPTLQISTGRIGGGGLTLFALAVIAIVSVVLYGLNSGAEPSAAQHPAPLAGNSAPAGAQSKTNSNG